MARLIALYALAGLLALPLAAHPAEPGSGLPEPRPAPAAQRWGRSTQVFERIAAEAEQAARARSPLTLGHLYRLWNVNNLVDAPKRLDKALTDILAQADLDPFVRAHAEYMRAQRLARAGKLDEAHQQIAKVGLVTEAMLVGPFENSAGQGHEEPFPPELGLRLDEPMEGKAHAVRWHEVKGLAELGVFELSHLVQPATEATAYVLVAVEAKQPTSAALRTGSTDQLKAFLNGAEVFALDTRRAANLDQDAIPLALPAGKSVLLLKSSWSGGSGRLLIRLTAPDGRPLTGVAVRGDRGAIATALAARRPGPGRAGPGGVTAKQVRLARRASRQGQLEHRAEVACQRDRYGLPALRALSARCAGPRPLPLAGARPSRTRSPKVAAARDAADRAVATLHGHERARALGLRADLAAVLGLYDRRKLPTPPEQDLEDAIRLDASDPLLRFFYAHRVHERDPTVAREQLEAALVVDPSFAPALYRLGDLARSSGRTLDAQRRFSEAIARDPEFLLARVALSTLRFEGDLDRDLALASLAAVAEETPTPAILDETARMHLALENRGQAEADSARALALDFTDSEARARLIGAALDRGDTETALRELDRAIRLAPWQLGHRIQKARVLAGVPSQKAQALATLEEAGRAFPDSPEVPNAVAELLLFEGDRKGALAALERSLELDPQQTEVRRHRGMLRGEHLELEDEFGVDATALVAAPVSPEETAWGAIYLTDRTAIRLYENGQSSRFEQQVLRLRNASLKDAVRVHQIPYTPGREIVEILSAERIRPSGEVIKASNIGDTGPGGKVAGMYLDRRFKSVTFDDMAAGDLVHLRYRIDSLGQNIFGGFFGDIADVQSALPKRDVLYTVITPKSRPLYHGELRAPPPAVSEKDGTVRLSWTFDKLEAIDIEPYAPPYPELGTMLSVSTYKSWSDLGRWYANLYAEQLELDADARAAGRKAIAGAKTQAEKITRLYDYVVKNTRYVGIELGIHGWKPFKAAEVHRRRYGDCKDKATLLAALLRDNGIDAAVTLVRTADRGKLPGDLATMWAFNHAITFVPSQNLFLDGTAEFSGSHELPYQDQGAMGLIVSPDGTTRLVTLPETGAAENLNASSYVATLTREGALELEGVERFFGARAAPMRQEFEEDEQRTSLLEKQLNQVFAGAHVSELSFSDLGDLEIPVEYHYKAAIDRYGVEENGRYLIPVALFQHEVASVYASLASRKEDLFGNHAWATRNVVRYRLPRGAEIETLPEGQVIETAHIKLEQTVRRVPGGFETDDTVTLKSRRIPAADYAEFRMACLAVDRALARRVVIRW